MSSRQPRISIGADDLIAITAEVGAEAAGLYFYLRGLMRRAQTSEITLTMPEIAAAVKLAPEAAEAALSAICEKYMVRKDDDGGMITLTSPSEERAQREAHRKRVSRALSRSRHAIDSLTGGQSCGQSEHIFFDHSGQSADSPQEVYSEVAMYYHPGPGEPRDESSYYLRKKKAKENHALFDKPTMQDGKEKAPQTPEKEKTHTESGGPAHTSAHVREQAEPALRKSAATRADEIELPSDELEANYIDVCSSMQPSLRKTLREADPDTREAFYLYCRKKREELGSRWTGDSMRAAWLAARRIPSERRADSILAAYQGDWKTIRDCGSGVYFEKETGRVVSLVRGPVESVCPQGGTASKAARAFARGFREE